MFAIAIADSEDHMIPHGNTVDEHTVPSIKLFPRLSYLFGKDNTYGKMSKLVFIFLVKKYITSCMTRSGLMHTG
jgi:hypothetical protein